MADLRRVDEAVYAAIAATPTPVLDGAMRRLSRAADHSKLWIASAAGLALFGRQPGRRAAAQGMLSVAVTSVIANAVAKQLLRRPRPDQSAAVIHERQVAMPTSTSFPSGHAASAFAFATAASAELPGLALPLYVAATSVGYSRVHTGVHYPGDVIVGAIIGSVIGGLVSHGVRSRAASR